MSPESEKRQKTEQMELPLEYRGEAPTVRRSGEALTAANGDERSGTDRLMEEAVECGNVDGAIKRVRKNKGSPGTDGMTVGELAGYLAKHWAELRGQLLAGTYQPGPVRRREIEKEDGGVRVLGIPCVLDRFVQQAILQVLQPRFDPTFSQHSYGFRPGRGAHDAVNAAQRFIQEGRRWVVDVDLEKFFDRVNHDVLMGRLAKRIADKRLLKLIRRYLEAGMMINGVVMERLEGTPQGGPLSPLMANVLLDEVDKELEKRGHAFVRYADDCNVYVRSERAGERVLEALKRLYAGLRLKVNESKSAVATPWSRKFLGYSFWLGKGGEIKRKVAVKAIKRLKKRIREITRRSCGKSMKSVFAELRGYLLGWKEYFRLADTPGKFGELDGWIRRRLIAVQLTQWKRGTTVYGKLRALGLSERSASAAAAHVKRWWRTAAHGALKTAFPISYFDLMKVPRLAA
ncbi:MAG: group II intron reverse transcriptase/maturase [Lentisphaerae bacterium RIFOXYA12_64_32]|nr:MAG: group II intron reverse transcriptase/maturase [Lentisphaerae bacterium RIFOXYA12_64_32]